MLVAVLAGGLLLRRASNDHAGPDNDLTAPPTSPVPQIPDSSGGADGTPSTSVTSTPGGYQPRFESAACQFEQPPGYSPECGYLVVPQDRENPDGPEVRLHVAVFPAESDLRAPDPVVYLEGGPGGEALEVLNLVFEDRFAPFLIRRDVIVFDQRGTGYSEPSLACEPYRDLGFEMLDDLLEPEESLALEYDVLAGCRDQYLADGVDLNQYNSADSAADLADLRTALGISEWNLYGISYGTRLALTAMRDHPEGIRSVILDSSYPPEVDGVASIPANAARAFDVLFAGCAADNACAEAFPDLERRLFDLVDRLDASPISVPVVDVFTGRDYTAVLTGGDLLGVIFQALYDESLIRSIPQLIDQVEQDDYRDLGNLLSLFIANGEFFSVGMHASVQCYEEVPFSDPEATREATGQYPYMARIVEGSITQSTSAWEFCEMWGTGPGDPIEAEPVSSDIPAVVLAGEYDPITPPADGAAVARRLPNATYLEFPGLGHAVTSAECPRSIVIAFLDDPTGPLDLSCRNEMGEPDFETPGEPAEEIVLVPFEDDQSGIRGLVPDGWESFGFGTYVRQATALDQTALIQQAVAGTPADLVLQLVAGQLGLEDDPQPIAEFESGGKSWTRYQGELQGFVADIAVADADGLAYLVVLLSDPDERDGLVADVLLPVLDAIDAEG